MKALQFQVAKNNFIEGATIETDLMLSDGEVILEIEHFAYTSNNTTYAVIGSQMGYWNFFPTQDPTTKGIIPTWGFGKVVESKCDDIPVGKKYYGYFPMASHLKVTPGKITKHGFDDMAPHRAELPPLYNKYYDSDTDMSYQAETEHRQLIFRPLFMTSFLINSMLLQHDMYEATQIILTSASSKTALALAFCLKDNANKNIKIVGLTSSRNLDFVSEIGYYDEVLTYDNYRKIANDAAVIVDFSGNHNLQADLQDHLGDNLKYNCLVGLVHKEAMRGDKELRAKGTFFFAPTYFKQAMDYMGVEAFFTKSGTLQYGFIKASHNWLDINHQQGPTAMLQVHQDITNGKINPREGIVISLN